MPNIKYKDRKRISFGAMLDTDDIKYYVSFSSFTKQQEANILISYAIVIVIDNILAIFVFL